MLSQSYGLLTEQTPNALAPGHALVPGHALAEEELEPASLRPER
jgi:hypothetical protein